MSYLTAKMKWCRHGIFAVFFGKSSFFFSLSLVESSSEMIVGKA